MDDAELQQIRAARMRELKNQPGGGGANGAGAGQPSKNDEMLASVLAQLLTQPARERLNRVRIVKPERATQVEQLLVRMAQTGQLGQRVDESMLKSLLDRLAQQDQSAQRLVINRRTDNDEDDLDSMAPTKPTAAPTPATNDDSDSDFFD